MSAWRGWYHVDGHTYGSWLPGDPRGWRAWKHREHCEGDYRNPPPAGAHADLFQRSQRLMKHPPVRLAPAQRRAALGALVDKLRQAGVTVLAGSVDAVHYHLLAHFGAQPIRQVVGRAKKNASHCLRAHGLVGTVWAKRCRAMGLRDRQHLVNVFNYIVAHRRRGACVWTVRDGHGADGKIDGTEEWFLVQADGWALL